MSEDRRAVIEAALRRTTTAEDWVAGMAAGIERAVAEWERTREPTDADPIPIDLVHELHEAIYGYSYARPESPKVLWEELLRIVRAMADGKCGECERRAARDVRQNT
jgi:hypothetical protein